MAFASSTDINCWQYASVMCGTLVGFGLGVDVATAEVAAGVLVLPEPLPEPLPDPALVPAHAAINTAAHNPRIRTASLLHDFILRSPPPFGNLTAFLIMPTLGNHDSGPTALASEPDGCGKTMSKQGICHWPRRIIHRADQHTACSQLLRCLSEAIPTRFAADEQIDRLRNYSEAITFQPIDDKNEEVARSVGPRRFQHGGRCLHGLDAGETRLQRGQR
jgi:hypothetical protein